MGGKIGVNYSFPVIDSPFKKGSLPTNAGGIVNKNVD